MNLAKATIMTAMVTPFDETGAIDFSKLPQLVAHLLENHTEGIILAGTTGESPTLTHEEEINVCKKVVHLVAGRVPIICGVGTNDTKDSVEFVKEISTIGGIDAGLAVVPYYNKPNQEGMYQHFKAIAEASDLPIILYNVPGRTVVNLTVETSLRLAELDTIIAIKECSGIEAVTELIEKAPKDFLVYTGNDSEAFATRALGGQGVISVASHVLGNELYEMFRLLTAGDLQAAASIQRKLLPQMDALFSVPSPAPIKAVLNHLKIPVGELRLPLVPCTAEEKTKILKVLGL